MAEIKLRVSLRDVFLVLTIATCATLAVWVSVAIQHLGNRLQAAERDREVLSQQVKQLGGVPRVGQRGYTVPQTPTASPGPAISPGPTGPTGPIGSRDPTGSPGPVGSPGSPGSAGRSYRLAPLGLALEPVVHALGRWGWNWMDTPAEHRSVEWLFVALRRRYRGGARLTAELLADGVPYRFVLAEDGAQIERGTLPGERVVVASLAGIAAAVAAAGLGSPATVVIGEVVRLRERLGAVLGAVAVDPAEPAEAPEPRTASR